MTYHSLTPMPHQARVIKENKPKVLLDWEMRTGKTLPACYWVDAPEQAGNTYIITLKKNKKSWQEMGTKATVMTKDEFRIHHAEIVAPTAIVVDEAHYFASELFTKKGKNRSAIADELYRLVSKYPDCHIMLLTATPVRQDAWSFHTLLCYLDEYHDWKQWREQFFNLEESYFIFRPKWMKKGEIPKAWFSKPNWRELLDPIRTKYSDQVSLSEVVDFLPPVHSRVVTIKQKPYERPLDRITTWIDEHYWEQQGKVQEILELGYHKVILVCKYTKQIDELSESLKDEKQVFILDGRTKHPEDVIKAAQEAKECYFIVQSSCGEGWDGWQFGAMVFVSMEHTYVSNVQMHGRQRHPKHLRDIEIVYLVGGRWDQKILDSYNKAEDFNPHKL